MIPPKLLTRDEFKAEVFRRDRGRCRFCDQPAVDAHHILDRALFEDGGYYVDNGVAVCAQHHLDCERTLISVEAVRAACGITRPLLPEHFDPVDVYDKWGNLILPNGQRLRGEMFDREGVQKALVAGGMLALFTNRVKYPRTYHAPWSEGLTADDRKHPGMEVFHGRRVIVTEKMDGENTTGYADGYIHARSIDGRHHPSRDLVKSFWAGVAGELPADWRVTGENVFARHSIAYEALPHYFLGINIWDERNVCLGWDTTVEWFDLLGITPVPVLYDGIYDEALIRALNVEQMNTGVSEGCVIRVADEFSFGQFRKSLAKVVRPNHVQTDQHWMHGPLVRNGLARDA